MTIEKLIMVCIKIIVPKILIMYVPRHAVFCNIYFDGKLHCPSLDRHYLFGITISTRYAGFIIISMV